MVQTFTAGQRLTATDLNTATYPGNLVARHVRTSASSTTTSSTGVVVIYLDIPVTSGRMYRIGMDTSVHHDSTVTTDNVASRIVYTTNGTTPTTSSTILEGAHVFSICIPMFLSTTYEATFTGTLKTALCVARASGTGNARIYADVLGRAIIMAAYDVGLPAGGGSNA